MKRKVILIIWIAVLICINTSCLKNLQTDSFDQTSKTDTIHTHTNIVTQSPSYETITYELDKRLIGKYEAENDPKMYFEIKPDGKAIVSLNNLEGHSTFSSENLLVTAYYYNPAVTKRVLLTFHLLNGENHFPLDCGMSINFESQGNELYHTFIPLISNSEIKVNFVKVT